MTTTVRRLCPGTRLDSAFDWPFEPIDNLDSSFHVQEYLQQLIRQDHTNVDTLVEIPESVDRQVWQYEHLRQVCIELNQLVVALETECTKENCPEMKADGWLYLCAAHSSTQSVTRRVQGLRVYPTRGQWEGSRAFDTIQCPAIDYIIHTLDGATILLNNSKYFPSRISVPEPSLKHFQSIARRLYRIFAHAYFHHRETYDLFENETCLYARFLLLSKSFSLVPRELISIPDGTEVDEDQDDHEDDDDEDGDDQQGARGQDSDSADDDDNQSQVTAVEA